MKRILLLISFITFFSGSKAQEIDLDRVTMVEFINVVGGNWQEALYYYRNNWVVIHQKAKDKGAIQDFNMISFQDFPDREMDIVLITEFKDKDQMRKSQEKLSKIKVSHGTADLLNELRPAEFRKRVYFQIGN